MRIPTGFLPAVLAVSCMMGISGCFNPFAPRIASNRGISESAPRPDSPRNVLRLFEWCWEHTAIAEYREIFTDDFRFAFATTDSSGIGYLERGFTRDDELASATNLFLGGDANQPRATRIILDFDGSLFAFPDSRPGKTDPWHKEIFTRVDLTIETDESVTRISGSARFFVVRGDSALIPQELRDRGFGPDPNRWYIERYEEENPETALALAAAVRHAQGGATAPLPPSESAARTPSGRGAAEWSGSPQAGCKEARSHPLTCVTWGCFKDRYR